MGLVERDEGRVSIGKRDEKGVGMGADMARSVIYDENQYLDGIIEPSELYDVIKVGLNTK